MTFEDILKVVKQVRYKDKKVVASVRGVKFLSDDEETLCFDIMVIIPVKDRVTGEDDRLYTHYTYSPEEMKYLEPQNIVRRIKSMLIYLESHEVEEQLTYKGRRVFDPHTKKLSGPNVKREKRNREEYLESVKTSVIKQLKEKKDELSKVQN